MRIAKLPSMQLETIGNIEYDPHEHRVPKKTIPLWMAYLNVLRMGFGAGVLGIPLAISQIGIVLGAFVAMATGVLIVHTHLMLLRCLYHISKRLRIPRISYRYAFRMALLHGPPCCRCFGEIGPTLLEPPCNGTTNHTVKHSAAPYRLISVFCLRLCPSLLVGEARSVSCIIATFMIMSQIGICTVFVLFTTDGLRDLMDWKTSKPSYFVLLPAYLILEYFMNSLKTISYVSMLGNVMNFVALILVFYHIFEDPHGRVVHACTEPRALCFAFGTFMFNLSAIGVILSMDRVVKDRGKITQRFGVVTVGILVPVTIATIFGCLGYYSFGPMEENVLRYLPFDTPSAMAAITLYSASIVLAYPLQCYPGISIILEVIKNHDPENEPSEETLRGVESFARPIFVILSFIIAFTVPFQGPFVAFVGNLCTTILALVCPALMEICLMYPGPYGKFNFLLIKNLIIIVIGTMACISGVILCGSLIHSRVTNFSARRNDEFI